MPLPPSKTEWMSETVGIPNGTNTSDVQRNEESRWSKWSNDSGDRSKNSRSHGVGVGRQGLSRIQSLWQTTKRWWIERSLSYRRERLEEEVVPVGSLLPLPRVRSRCQSSSEYVVVWHVILTPSNCPLDLSAHRRTASWCRDWRSDG